MRKAIAGILLAQIASIFLWSPTARADALDDSMDYWRSQAFVCSDGHGGSFPSKSRTPDAENASDCDDGDMTLFNGLLCASGEKQGCEGVKKAQDINSGRWWRSPRRIGFESPRHDVSFSPDQAAGVLLYAVETKDVVAFKKWVEWIDTHRPCILEVGNSCYIKGWPRLCTDDQIDKRCTFRLGTCADIEFVGKLLGDNYAAICREVLKAFGMDVKDFIYPTEMLAAGAAIVNEPNYPLHLAAVQVFLLKKSGFDSGFVKAAGLILAERDSANPFFLYLAEGATPKVRELLLSECPTPGQPSLTRSQWAWERPSSEEAWKKSMYWDCIFMGKLLGSAH